MEYKALAQRWVERLMEGMDDHPDMETRIELMEAYGQACTRIGPARVTRDCQGNLEQMERSASLS